MRVCSGLLVRISRMDRMDRINRMDRMDRMDRIDDIGVIYDLLPGLNVRNLRLICTDGPTLSKRPVSTPVAVR